MNKYREAYYWIEKCYYGSNQGYFNEEQLLWIKELVDKEIPMKPYIVLDEENGEFVRAECGRCGNNLYHLERCSSKECGQVVDWSDQDE